MNIDLMDYFAAKAMQSLLSDETIKEIADEEGVDFPSLVSKLSYDVAVCMMAERTHLIEGAKRDSVQ